MKVTVEASDKRRVWPWLIVAALICGELWVLWTGTSFLIWQMPPSDPLIDGCDCWYFDGISIEGPFDALEGCPIFAPEGKEPWR